MCGAVVKRARSYRMQNFCAEEGRIRLAPIGFVVEAVGIPQARRRNVGETVREGEINSRESYCALAHDSCMCMLPRSCLCRSNALEGLHTREALLVLEGSGVQKW